MTADHRFEEVLNEDSENTEKNGKEIRNMCDVLDRIENKGRAEGKKEMAISLYEQGVELPIIANAAGVAVDVINKWIKLTTV